MKLKRRLLKDHSSAGLKQKNRKRQYNNAAWVGWLKKWNTLDLVIRKMLDGTFRDHLDGPILLHQHPQCRTHPSQRALLDERNSLLLHSCFYMSVKTLRPHLVYIFHTLCQFWLFHSSLGITLTWKNAHKLIYHPYTAHPSIHPSTFIYKALLNHSWCKVLTTQPGHLPTWITQSKSSSSVKLTFWYWL